MFELGDRVIVIQGRNTGYIGTVIKIFTAGMVYEAELYMVRYDDSFCTGSGQFEAHELKSFMGD